MNTITLDSCYHDVPKEGDFVKLKNTGAIYFVKKVEKIQTGEGMDIEAATRFTLQRLHWYHRVWFWIKRNVYGK
jgi:hypothetical protein